MAILFQDDFVTGADQNIGVRSGWTTFNNSNITVYAATNSVGGFGDSFGEPTGITLPTERYVKFKLVTLPVGDGNNIFLHSHRVSYSYVCIYIRGVDGGLVFQNNITGWQSTDITTATPGDIIEVGVYNNNNYVKINGSTVYSNGLGYSYDFLADSTCGIVFNGVASVGRIDDFELGDFSSSSTGAVPLKLVRVGASSLTKASLYDPRQVGNTVKIRTRS